MGKSLVVVESPAKARTINKFLGPEYVVKASFGHVRDLPKRELGVDLDNDFQPSYALLPESAKPMKAIKDAAAGADRILLATDPDREGEAIGWHVAELLKPVNKPVLRIVFNEITRRSVREAANNPREIDENLVNAQQARRVLDRIVGYKISPLLQWGVGRGLSAGRVQSVAVRMVCDREAEIRAFVPEEYWTLDAAFTTGAGESFITRLFRINGEKARVGSEEQMQSILRDLQKRSFVVANVERKEVRRRPPAPFITSTLQQEASRRLGSSPRNTMRVAQQLYEGLPLGPEGSVGLISYMRTDSTRIAREAIDEVRAFIRDRFGEDMLPDSPNFYPSKRGAQDAHEAIRPTSPARTPESIERYLNKEQLALYRLIWMRFVACQMAAAVLDQTTIDVAGGPYEFRAVGSVVKFPGFTKFYEESRENWGKDALATSEESGNGEVSAKTLPLVRKDEPLALGELHPEQRFTKPPPRYTEASLIRALEENGIGRPSTYAPTMNTIMERGYVVREKGQLRPTELGEQVNRLLVVSFPDILDLKFTAQLEENLDQVEEGHREWHDLLRAFYSDFAKTLDTAQRRLAAEALQKEAVCPTCAEPMEFREGRFGLFLACRRYPECKTTQRVERRLAETTDEVCEQCGAPMVIRQGRFGRFLACTNYPKCKNTHNIGKDGSKIARVPKEPPQKSDQKCPKCGSFLLIRKTRRSGEEFYGCEKYPKCKFTKPMELGLRCLKPGCEGNLVPKRAARRTFIGCDKYPACDFTVPGKPDKAVPCPKCGNAWTVRRRSRVKGELRQCLAPGCGYEEPIAENPSDA